MLRMQERLYSHKFYRQAGGEVFTSKDDGDGKEAEMSAAERKKMKHQKKRQEKKDESQTASKVTPAGGKPKKVDDDPEGEKLLEKDPMQEASKLVKTLVMYCDADAATHTLTYEVASRQGKLLLEQWHPQGAFALKECNKMLSYLAGEYGKDSPVWERFKQRCLDLFPLMVIR